MWLILTCRRSYNRRNTHIIIDTTEQCEVIQYFEFVLYIPTSWLPRIKKQIASIFVAWIDAIEEKVDFKHAFFCCILISAIYVHSFRCPHIQSSIVYKYFLLHAKQKTDCFKFYH
jgi:hypothetical protein